jgi:cytochrome c-type biogenesis protein CcmE
MTTARRSVLAALLAALALAGCDCLPFGYTPVKDITAAPANFEGKEVKLKGKVRDVIKLPIVDLKAYTVQDESGEITVTTHGALPAANAEVALKGTVKSAVIIGGHSLGLRVEETKRLR